MSTQLCASLLNGDPKCLGKFKLSWNVYLVAFANYTHVNNCEVDKASMFAFPSSHLMVLCPGAFCLHHHFLGFLRTRNMAILYGIQCVITLDIFPRLFGKGMNCQHTSGPRGVGCCSLKQYRPSCAKQAWLKQRL